MIPCCQQKGTLRLSPFPGPTKVHVGDSGKGARNSLEDPSWDADFSLMCTKSWQGSRPQGLSLSISAAEIPGVPGVGPRAEA